MATNVEWTKDILLIRAILRKTRPGGLPAEERRALAEEFGVSEAVVLRYERARCTYESSIAEKRRRQAKMETILRMTEGEKELDPEKFPDELEATLERLMAAEPENEITRELRAVRDAIRAELGLPPVPLQDPSGVPAHESVAGIGLGRLVLARGDAASGAEVCLFVQCGSRCSGRCGTRTKVKSAALPLSGSGTISRAERGAAQSATQYADLALS